MGDQICYVQHTEQETPFYKQNILWSAYSYTKEMKIEMLRVKQNNKKELEKMMAANNLGWLSLVQHENYSRPRKS